MNQVFRPDEHILNVLDGARRTMYDDAGVRLDAITGVAGAGAVLPGGLPIGVDRITMQPGTAFPLHVHEGAHLLYVLNGRGALHIDGRDYVLRTGDSIYVPAEYPHGVQGPIDDNPLDFLAFGVPHHPIDSHTRMVLVRDDELLAGAALEEAAVR
ncbi:cupin domain-containing protein [Kitasatospora sp. DSM 101779]|uniref:cupin domain-containing protein n=1 Tax=Kitasatospora sp. DSM 101779 TaxID=2853165 RepID=UPI0021D8AF31|nr:cupin domain-containing protein [Kitasatospora sp. DSM 101779]MCU7822137.1 cupin domain-containing protein [Kitasatospora sp. DSM 101779]